MKKRYKLILIIVISFLLAIFIYFSFRKKEKNYLFIGDDMSLGITYNFNDYFLENKENIVSHKINDNFLIVDEFVNYINNNVNKINYYINNSDYIVVSLGTSELNNYENINEEIMLSYLNDVYTILLKINRINKKKKVLINMYDEKYTFINNKIESYAKSLNYLYIDINNVHGLYLLNNRTILSNESQKEIGNMLNNYFVN